MVSITSRVCYAFLSFVVAVTFLFAGYDIYHKPIPQATTGYRDYPTKLTVGNFTHDFHGAAICEDENRRDLSSELTEETIKECFAQFDLILNHGVTPVCEKHELAEIDWYYKRWYHILVVGMVLYGFFLLMIATHDISVLCKGGNIWCEDETWEGDDESSPCHCVKFRKLIQLVLFFLMVIFVVGLGIGSVMFTDLSAISSSFMGNFKYNEDGQEILLPCTCGCVLQTPTFVGWTLIFSMHMFMWVMLQYLAKIKRNYKMNPQMLTVVAPVPIDMGVYGVNDANFWMRVLVPERSESEQEPYSQIHVNTGNQSDKIQCSCCTLEDWTITVLSYRMFYTLLVAVVWVVILDGTLFFFQIVIRSFDESNDYKGIRASVHIFLTLVCWPIMYKTFIYLRMIKLKSLCSNLCSVLFNVVVLNGVFNWTAYFAFVFLGEYTNIGWVMWVWIIGWIIMALALSGMTVWTLVNWRYYAKNVIDDTEVLNYTLRLFEVDSMIQNLLYFYLCGAPQWFVFPERFNYCPNYCPFTEGKRRFARATSSVQGAEESSTRFTRATDSEQGAEELLTKRTPEQSQAGIECNV